MHKKLSVCIATYNEAKNIKRTLASVLNWVDEIVIVDGRSTDETVKIARSFGEKVKVFLRNNPANFLENRGQAMKQAQSLWLLVLDADEVVSKELKKEILTAINSRQYDGYWLPRLNHFLGKPLKKGGQYPDLVLRLVKREKAYQPTKTLHDQVSVKTNNSRIGFFKQPLWHYPYPDFETYLRKWIQYCSFEAEEMKQHKYQPSVGLMFKYCFWLPFWWFIKTYFRHKGFVDGFAGFIFAFFSSLRYMAIYIKLYEQN